MSLAGKRKPIRQTIMGLFGFFLTFTVLVGSAFISFIVYRIEADIWRERRRDAAENAAETVNHFIARNLSLLTFSIRDLALEPERDKAELELLLQSDPAFEEIVQVRADGTIVQFAAKAAPVLGNSFAVRQSNWFRQVKEKGTYLGPVEFSADGQPYVILAVSSPSGEALVARIGMLVLRDVVETIQFGTSGQIYIVDQDGYLLVHPDAQLMKNYNSITGYPELSDALVESESGWDDRYINLEGHNVLGTFHRIEQTGWLVFAEVDAAEAYSYSRTTWLIQLGGLTLVGILAMFGSSRLLDRWIFNPVNALRNATEEIQQGNLDVRVPIFRIDEIGDVAFSFNRMAETLGEHEDSQHKQAEQLRLEVMERQLAQQALQQVNRDLEERVRTRTIELTETNLRLSESESRFHGLVENIPAITYIADLREDGPVVTYVSPQVGDILGYTPAEWINERRWLLQVHSADYAMLVDYYEQMYLTGERYEVDYRLLTRDGRVVWIRDQGIIQEHGENARFIQGVMSDITFEREKREILVQQALHDSLTGLPNRALLLERLWHIMTRAQRHHDIKFAVFYLDLDGFKFVNDNFGHAWGDQVLIETATRLKGCVRDFDTVARQGGDEFVVLVEDPRDQEAVQVMRERIESEIARPFIVADQEVRLGVSIGISCCDHAFKDPEEMLHAADLVMYREKMMRKGKVRATASLKEQALKQAGS